MPWKPAHADDFPTLGWGVLEWWADHLPSPRDSSSEFILTDSQARDVLEWFRIDPVTGRYVYRRGYSRRSKGRGKSPIEAAKAIVEFAGPVRFDGWDSAGRPVGRPWGREGDPLPWVQVGAVSEDQTDNTWSVLYYFLTENEGRAADELGIDAGLTRCFLRGQPGAKLEPVTSAAGTREGQPITYAVLDETHLWTPRNGGVKLARTLRRNVAKMNGRTYETTNSFVPGEGSVAEGSYKAAQMGSPGVYADEVEAPRVVDGVAVDLEAPDPVLRSALQVAYGADTWWVDLDRIVAEIRDPDTKWDDSCRFFFNWNQKAGGLAVDPAKWAELAEPQDVPAKTRIGVGFDGSISDDTTGLIGCTADGFLWVIGAWERKVFDDGRPDRNWRVPRLEVGARVRETFEKFDVGRMFGDPPKWATELETWADEFRLTYGTTEERERVLAFDTNQRSKFCKAVDRFLTAVREGSLRHADDDKLNAHVLASALEKVRVSADDADQRTMYVLIKPEDSRKIDLAVAAVLAYEAAMTMPETVLEPSIYVWQGGAKQ
jgi:hypothetical protein